jgi:thiol:disulfide interchange protein
MTMSTAAGTGVQEAAAGPADATSAPAVLAGSTAPATADHAKPAPSRPDAAQIAEATTALMNAAAKAINKSAEALENSSRWTLLFITFLAGVGLAVAPCVLIWTRGDLAATAPEYVVTSLSGGVVALAGLVGLIVSDRGAHKAAADLQEQSTSLLA